MHFIRLQSLAGKSTGRPRKKSQVRYPGSHSQKATAEEKLGAPKVKVTHGTVADLQF